MFNKYKFSALAASLFCVSAQAAITVGSVFWQDTVIPSPTSTPIKINYGLFGSQFVRPFPSVDFYLTQDNGQTGFRLGSDGADLNCVTGSRCLANGSVDTFTANTFTMGTDTINYLNSLCEPTEYKVIALFNGSSALSLNSSTLGQQGQADWLFVSGTMTPTTVAINGTISVDYAVANAGCSVPGLLPRVGVFLTDSSLTPLQFFGDIPVASSGGSSHSFSLSLNGIPAGDYRLALVADRTNVNVESNENNNIGTFNLTIVDSSSPSNFESLSGDSALPRTRKAFIDPTPENAEFASDDFTFDIPVSEGLKLNKVNKPSLIEPKAVAIPNQE